MQTLQSHSQLSRFARTAAGGQPAPCAASGRSGWRGRGWLALCVVATLLSLVSFRYVLPHVPFPIRNSNFVLRRPWLVTHVVSASVALLVGPWQFLKRLRIARRELHRRIGWVYVIAVVIGWISSIPVALHAPSGVPAQAGYIVLGLAWIITTSLGLSTAIQGQFEEHRRWMTRSYALACGAITLRLILPVCLVSGMSFKHAEPLSVWACWIVNLCIAQYLLRAPAAGTKPTEAGSKAFATSA
jgi:uncharacterized membrane protein